MQNKNTLGPDPGQGPHSLSFNGVRLRIEPDQLGLWNVYVLGGALYPEWLIRGEVSFWRALALAGVCVFARLERNTIIHTVEGWIVAYTPAGEFLKVELPFELEHKLRQIESCRPYSQPKQ
jgi:hypothetical protein